MRWKTWENRRKHISSGENLYDRSLRGCWRELKMNIKQTNFRNISQKSINILGRIFVFTKFRPAFQTFFQFLLQFFWENVWNTEPILSIRGLPNLFKSNSKSIRISSQFMIFQNPDFFFLCHFSSVLELMSLREIVIMWSVRVCSSSVSVGKFDQIIRGFSLKIFQKPFCWYYPKGNENTAVVRAANRLERDECEMTAKAAF